MSNPVESRSFFEQDAGLDKLAAARQYVHQLEHGGFVVVPSTSEVFDLKHNLAELADSKNSVSNIRDKSTQAYRVAGALAQSVRRQWNRNRGPVGAALATAASVVFATVNPPIWAAIALGVGVSQIKLGKRADAVVQKLRARANVRTKGEVDRIESAGFETSRRIVALTGDGLAAEAAPVGPGVKIPEGSVLISSATWDRLVTNVEGFEQKSHELLELISSGRAQARFDGRPESTNVEQTAPKPDLDHVAKTMKWDLGVGGVVSAAVQLPMHFTVGVPLSWSLLSLGSAGAGYGMKTLMDRQVNKTAPQVKLYRSKVAELAKARQTVIADLQSLDTSRQLSRGETTYEDLLSVGKKTVLSQSTEAALRSPAEVSLSAPSIPTGEKGPSVRVNEGLGF